MEIFLRLVSIFIKLICYIIYPLIEYFRPTAQDQSKLPAIDNDLITLNIKLLQQKLCTRQLSSKQIVEAYILRIKAVNTQLNAVIEERFSAAVVDAEKADELIRNCNDAELKALFEKYPLLGLPMTVKESCALKNMSFTVGSLNRVNMRAENDCDAVGHLRAAGAIPLLVSTTPENCYSIETYSYAHGRTLNPYNYGRTPGGSSGGECALNGAGASLFGVGSDLAGSIRIPSLFCGVFGHKPTGGLVSTNGHMPTSNEEAFPYIMQMGPISRYATNLPLLLKIMAGRQASKLTFDKPVKLTDININYSLGFDGLNGFLHLNVDLDIKAAILRAVEHFNSIGLVVNEVNFKSWHNSLEMGFSALMNLKNLTYLLQDIDNQYVLRATIKELCKAIIGRSRFMTNSLLFELLRRKNAFISPAKLEKYRNDLDQLKKEFCQLLGNNGVLMMPTLPQSALRHRTSLLITCNIDYTLLFNALGLPVTHVPMGLDRNGLPIGFSIIAASYQDKLCFGVAEELEQAFGGWVPPFKS